MSIRIMAFSSSIWVLQTGAGTADCVGNGLDRFVLADDALMQMLFQLYQLLALALLQSRDGNVRPTRNNFGDVFLGHFLTEQGASRSGLSGVGDAGYRTLCEFSLQVWNFAVLDFTSFG
jgi:hypothetical protein